jgi:flagellar basal body-associated protein fliL
MLKHTKTQLLGAGEQKLKADLLELINKELVLGNIDTLYFSDYIFLE